MRIMKWILLLVALSIVPSFSALGQSDDLPFQHTTCADGVDLTGQTISFYNLIDPYNEAVYYPIQAGYSDAAEYFNAHGGICGAAVTPVYDDALRQGILPAYVHIRSLTPKPVLVTLYGSGDGEDMLPYLANDEIVGLNVRAGSSASVYGQDGQTLGWEFMTNPLYVDQLGTMCDYIIANPDRFPKPVLGLLNFDDDWAKVSGQQGFGYCESLGIGYAGTSYFSSGSTYVQPQIQRLIDAGANILYTTSDDTGPAGVAKSLSDMGLKDKIPLLGVNRVMDSLPALTGEQDLDADGVPVISGMLGSASARSFAEQDNPGIQLISEQADLHKRPATMHNSDYVIGWDTTDLFIEVYIQTGNRVGFDHLTGADIKQTLENIIYMPMSGVARIDYQDGTRRALAQTRIAELNYLGQDGKTAASATNPPMSVKEGDAQHLVQMIVPLTDYLTAPDLRPGGADVPSSAATPEATVAPAATSAAEASIDEIAFYSDQTGDGEIYVMNADGSNRIDLTNNPTGDYIPVWSPDGREILFNSDRAGNSQIYVMDVASGQVTNLSNNASNDFFASWSPDGKQITFVSDRTGQGLIYLMNADGSHPRQMTDLEGEFPSWSPDGKQIVFGTGLPGEIYTVNVDGTGLSNLTNASSDDGLASWSPDGKRIAFTSNRDGSEEIYLMNPDGSDLVQLTHSDKPVYNHKSAWSPDGKQIVFVSTRDGNPELYTMNADGSDQTRLTNTPNEEEAPSWRPQPISNQAEATAAPTTAQASSNRIIFEAKRTGNSEIYIMNADGTGAANLTNTPEFDGEPVGSPDGKHIAYTCGNESSTDLCVMNADGSNQINLTNNPANDELATWSPDSQRIAFLSNRDGSNNDIYVMNVDGSNLVRLTDNPGFDGFPTWSPDGKQIAFGSDRDGNNDIYVMNADGSSVIRLTHEPSDDIFPYWSPDGAHILFTTNRDGDDELYVMNIDGTHQIDLTNNPAGDGGAAAWSPDSKQIVFTSGRDPGGFYIMNADGSDQSLITTDVGGWPSIQPNVMDVPASAEATAVPTESAAALRGRIVFEDFQGDNAAEIYVINADGSGLTQLTDTTGFDGEPFWSPDGTKIVFTSSRDGQAEIYVMNADGTDPVRLTNNPAIEELPSWSPDGSKILFNSERDGNPEVYLMNDDGSDPINLTNNESFDDFASWSPDGRQIVFTSDRDGSSQIYIMNADGSDVHKVSDIKGDSIFPAWSPDGTKILFNSDADGDMDIYVMNADGSNVTKLTDDTVDEEPGAWSPSGKQILFSSGQHEAWDVYLMNADGSELTQMGHTPQHEDLPRWTPSE